MFETNIESQQLKKERSLVVSDMRSETIDSWFEPMNNSFSETFTLQYMTYLYVCKFRNIIRTQSTEHFAEIVKKIRQKNPS